MTAKRRQGRRRSNDGIEQFVEGMVGFEGVTKSKLAIHIVAVAASFFGSRDHAGLLEIGEDSLDGAFRDTNLEREIADGGHGIARETHEDVGVICEEAPTDFIGAEGGGDGCGMHFFKNYPKGVAGLKNYDINVM